MLSFTYFLILKWYSPFDVQSLEPVKKLTELKLKELGTISIKEKAIGIIMIITIIMWAMLGRKIGLANIALSAVVILFVFELIKWKEVEEDVNWGIILMYGGAISLGYTLETSGGAKWMASAFLNSMHLKNPYAIIAIFSLISIFLTEAISNSAVVAMLLPPAIKIASYYSIPPEVMTLIITIPSGLAYTLPTASPPIAMAFSSGFIKTRDTFLLGMLLNIVSWAVFFTTSYLWFPFIGFGIGG